MLYFWSTAIQSCAETIVGLNRIEQFLLLPEKSSKACTSFVNFGFDSFLDVNSKPKSVKKFIKLENCSAFWCPKRRNGIKSVNLEIDSSVAIVGGTGSGKSTLLKTIIGEIAVASGSMRSKGSLSYASQEPWLFAGTIRQNIVFAEALDRERYAKVVQVCALEEDVGRMLDGDLTIVADGGDNLSGGQRARINLARAIYREADIYLLDDPLSPLDPEVRSFVLEKCVHDFLSDKIVVLVTHQSQHLTRFGAVVVVEDGRAAILSDSNGMNNNNISGETKTRNRIDVVQLDPVSVS